MKAPEPPSAKARRNSLEAAGWLERRERGLTPAEQDEFLQWLAADSVHGQWLALHQRTASAWTQLANWRPEHSERPNPDLLAPATKRSGWPLPTLFAAAAAIALAAFWWQPWKASPTAPPSVEAAAGYERRILEDGSAVELNRGAVVEVRFNPGERRVHLARGEALFTVTDNPQRPFIVQARGAEVRAIGTAFNVRLDAATMEVLVTEGRVRLIPATSAVAAPLVTQGHLAVVSLGTPQEPQITAVSPQQITRLLSWQPQLLDFSSTPLERVLVEFNRRNRVQLELADPALGELRVVATVRSDNLEGLLSFLADDFGVRAEQIGRDRVRLHGKPR